MRLLKWTFISLLLIPIASFLGTLLVSVGFFMMDWLFHTHLCILEDNLKYGVFIGIQMSTGLLITYEIALSNIIKDKYWM